MLLLIQEYLAHVENMKPPSLEQSVRNETVRILFNHVTSYTKKPDKKELEIFMTKVIKKYPVLAGSKKLCDEPEKLLIEMFNQRKYEVARSREWARKDQQQRRQWR